jgi:Chalcone isomerase-like
MTEDTSDTPLVAARRTWLATLLAVALVASGRGGAQTTAAASAPPPADGRSHAAELEVAGTRLRLNGAGVYSRVGIKPYAAGLYLQAPVTTAAQALAAPGPKRVRVRMLRELPAEEFSKALGKGLRRNSSEAQQRAFAEAMVALLAQIDGIVTARKGDVVDLDHDPGSGMSLRLNGTLRGSVLAGPAAAELYAATLLSFVGERPYSPELRAAMLGRTP